MPDCCIQHLHADAPSTSGRRVVIPRNEIPVELLVARHDARKVPSNALCSTAELRQAHKDAAWAGKREYMLAAAAAGVHLAMFAWNLAFWGFEGMPSDRWVKLAFPTRSLLTAAPLGCSAHGAEASHSRISNFYEGPHVLPCASTATTIHPAAGRTIHRSCCMRCPLACVCVCAMPCIPACMLWVSAKGAAGNRTQATLAL